MPPKNRELVSHYFVINTEEVTTQQKWFGLKIGYAHMFIIQ